MVACGGPAGAPSCGWIIPAPLAAPQIRTTVPLPASCAGSTDATGTTARAVLMRVSVVIMASTKASACCSELPIEALNSGIAATTLSAGNGTPMIPVEEGKTSSKMQPKLSAAATQVATQPSMPGSPLAQLALPELTSTAATRPPVAARWRRPTVTGAATTRLEVNMAAPTAAPDPAPRAIATARSRLPLDLIPARTAPHWNPAGSVPSVKTASSFIPLLYQSGGALRFLDCDAIKEAQANKNSSSLARLKPRPSVCGYLRPPSTSHRTDSEAVPFPLPGETELAE